MTSGKTRHVFVTTEGLKKLAVKENTQTMPSKEESASSMRHIPSPRKLAPPDPRKEESASSMSQKSKLALRKDVPNSPGNEESVSGIE